MVIKCKKVTKDKRDVFWGSKTLVFYFYYDVFDEALFWIDRYIDTCM
jgi:hypothetical protein